MNIDKLNQKLEEYYKNSNPEQIVKDLEAMGVELKDKILPKFRAWSSGKMYNDLAYITMTGGAMSKNPEVPLIKPILMQYIGLEDQDGKEIYEGDLLSYSIDGYPQAHPFYVDNVYQLHIELNRDDSYYRIDHNSLKIIGNVFEDLY